jgi:hypothetical protein
VPDLQPSVVALLDVHCQISATYNLVFERSKDCA